MKTKFLVLTIILTTILLAACTAGNGTLQGTVTFSGVTAANLPEGFFGDQSIEIVNGEEEVITTVNINQDGTYSVNLPSGNYIVRLPQDIILSATGLPTSVKIEAGKTTTLDIDLDSGIR